MTTKTQLVYAVVSAGCLVLNACGRDSRDDDKRAPPTPEKGVPRPSPLPEKGVPTAPPTPEKGMFTPTPMSVPKPH